MKKVLIADNEYFFAAGLRLYLQTKLDYELVGVVSNASDLPNVCREKNVDVLFLRDWWDCDDSSSVAISGLRETFPEMKIIVLVNNSMRAFDFMDKKYQIDGCLLPNASVQEVEDCMENALEGNAYSSLLSKRWGPLQSVFNRRELQIINLAVHNKTYEEIGEMLNLTRRGVVFHISNMMKKSGYKKLIGIIIEALQ